MKGPLHARLILLLVAILALTSPGPAQNPAASAPSVRKSDTLKDFRLSSKLMGREMPYRVILPSGYAGAKKDKRFPVLYLLHGLSGHFDNWTEKSRLTDHAKSLDLIIVMPEGGDGWYSDSATVSSDKYESYIVRELIPAVDREFRTVADRSNRMVAGLSMGGYGAIKFGLTNPGLFSVVGSFSGALDSPLRGQEMAFLRPSINSVFGPEGSAARNANDVFRMIREIPTADVGSLPYMYFSCGTEDVFFRTNREFADLLLGKKVPHEFRQLPGKHDWKFWDEQVSEFLGLAAGRLARK